MAGERGGESESPRAPMTPGRNLTRKEFDEVIRRAAEIAASEPEAGESALTETELLRIAGEVGLEERHVRKALAQVRSAPPTAGGIIASLYGPPFVVASRVVPGTKEALIETIDDLLDPYGGLGAYPREDQPSHQILQAELDSNRVTGAALGDRRNAAGI